MSRKNRYETNYDRLEELMGQPLGQLESERTYRLRSDQGFMALVVERLPRCLETGAAVLSLCHYFEQHGDLCQDPEMTVRAFLPGSTAFLGMVPATDISHGRLEALTFQQSIPPLYHEVYPEPGRYHPRLRESLNDFLTTWLRNLAAQGHRPVTEDR